MAVEGGLCRVRDGKPVGHGTGDHDLRRRVLRPLLLHQHHLMPDAITPAIIGFLVSLHNPDLPIVGIVLGVALIAQCLSIIPVTSAPAMIAYGVGGFTTRDMMRLGLPLAVIMYGLIVLFMFTYWPLVGLWK